MAETPIHGGRPDEIDYDAIALKWIMDVSAEVELDYDPLIISEDGLRAVEEALILDRMVYGADPSTDELEAAQRREELNAAIREITSQDEGVREKNMLLASWANMFDDVRELEADGIDPDSDEARHRNIIRMARATNMLDLFVHLNKQAGAIDETIRGHHLRSQFLGLWAIYKSGQDSVDA